MPSDCGQDRAAWIRGILDHYEGPLTLYAARIVGDVHRARDVVQDVFLRLCREDGKAIEARLAPWLYAVTRNRAVDERRKADVVRRAHAHVRNGGPTSTPDPAEAASTKDAASQAVEELGRLPESQQEVLRLRLQHGLSYDDIAEVMETTRGNVAVLAHRGLTALRTALGARVRPAAAAPQGEMR
jgi:RNA polymerase sigma factor (sigma-70 family)